MPNLLLELFSEEIPARMQQQTPKALLDNLLSKCVEAGLAKKADELEPKLFVTPRRIGIQLHNLPAQQPDVTIEKKGPKVGAPEKALEGFLKSCGQTLEQLEKRTVGKDEVYFSVVEQKGRPTAELLKELIETAIGELVWPKSMRWGSGDARWVRPLHSICCLLDSEIITVEFGDVKAGNATHGHRFLAPDEITISAPSEYEAKLKDANVIADWQARRAEIASQLEKLARERGLMIRKDEKLLDEVTGLVEWPVALLGTIEDRFMKLPHELLQVTMGTHQKYFTMEDSTGKIAAHFVFVANRTTEDGGKQIIAGNERVLRARFSDAEFFFAQDQKKPLAEWAKKLDKVTFHAKLGTVEQKASRIYTIAGEIANLLKLDSDTKSHISQAAAICKADLVTGMVGEFPELQGIMSSYYARAEGKPEEVCEALYHLYDHPTDLNGLGPVAQILCMADRLDTLISLFSIDEKPTGSKDPYALRRAALGVIAVIRNHGLRLNLSQILSSRDLIAGSTSATCKKDSVDPAIKSRDDELLAFFNDRLEADLRESGVQATTLRAIGGLLKDDDIIRVEARARALQEFLATPDSEPMLAGYKRAANILAAEEKKDKTSYNAKDLDAGLLKEQAEKELHTELAKLSETIQPLMEAEKFGEVMKAFAGLKAPLDKFFAEIMVNAEDAALRKNRLCLLATIVETMQRVADFGEIVK